MSEHDTNKMSNSRTFEERVFLRFDAMDTSFERLETRLDSLDGRVEKLEAKQYDTKPIWEQVLAAISEVSARLDETNTRLDARIDQTNTRLDQGFEQLRSEMKAAFANQQQQTAPFGS